MHHEEHQMQPMPGEARQSAGQPPARGMMTVVEAGQRGGQAVKKKYGSPFYRQIGQKGGQAVKEQRGSDFYRQLGKQGGAALAQQYPSAHFQAIGKKGGDTVKAQRGSDYYRQIGRQGGAAPRRANPSREQALRSAFDQLAQDDPPATPPKLAALTGWPLSSVHSVLKRVAWWGPAQRQAAQAAHYQRLHALLKEQGYPGIQAMQQHPPVRGRRLTLEQVQEIRQQLEQGNTPASIARQVGVHRNTVYSISQGRTWRRETPPGDEDTDAAPDAGPQVVQIAKSDATAQVQLSISRALWLALGSPAHLSLTRQGKRHVLTLAAASAEQGYPVKQEQNTVQLCIEGQVWHAFGLLPGPQYAAIKVNQQAQVRISDFPLDLAAEMLTLPDACEALHISRQRLSQVIASGSLQAWYDAERNLLVTLRSSVSARLAERQRSASHE